MSFDANSTRFCSALPIPLSRIVKEILGWRPGSKKRQRAERKRARDGEEEARGRGEGKGPVVYVRCLLT